MENKLLYVNEHLSCRNYVSDHRCFFEYYSWNSGVIFRDFNEKINYLVFVLEGECLITCGQFLNRTIAKRELIFLPPFAIRVITMEKDCQVLICSFDSPSDVCIKSTLQEIRNLPLDEINYDFSPTKIKDELWSFVNLLIVLLKQKINCKHVHEIKQIEMFLLFKFFYTKEELKWLFYEFRNEKQNFENFVMQNYKNVQSVDELVKLYGGSRTSFESQFKKVFNDSPGQWILKQLADRIRYKAADPDITIKELADAFNFNSTTHFFRFCQRHFGCTPTDLINHKGLI
uniref:helix-turn-helix transcriptional regulator n=1 Tax=Bacteroides fragilis TaxID=817 RepID=UPI00356A4F18